MSWLGGVVLATTLAGCGVGVADRLGAPGSSASVSATGNGAVPFSSEDGVDAGAPAGAGGGLSGGGTASGGGSGGSVQGGSGGTASGGGAGGAMGGGTGGGGAGSGSGGSGGGTGSSTGGSGGSTGSSTGGSGGSAVGGGTGGSPGVSTGASFPQGVPESGFIAAATSYGDTDPSVDAAVNAVMVLLTGCGVGSSCSLSASAGATTDEKCQSWFAAVTAALRAQGFDAGQHQEGGTDEIAVSSTGCTGKWYGYHVCSYGGPTVVWNGARRGWWRIDPSYCP